jgi:hypothetical protein
MQQFGECPSPPGIRYTSSTWLNFFPLAKRPQFRATALLLLYRFGLNTFDMGVFIEPLENLRTQLRSLALWPRSLSAAAAS